MKSSVGRIEEATEAERHAKTHAFADGIAAGDPRAIHQCGRTAVGSTTDHSVIGTGEAKSVEGTCISSEPNLKARAADCGGVTRCGFDRKGDERSRRFTIGTEFWHIEQVRVTRSMR